MRQKNSQLESRSSAPVQTVSHCPNCDSIHIKYFNHKKSWRCQDCDESFTGAPPNSVAKVAQPQTIFISYPHQPTKHAELALKFYQLLKDRGHHPWVDVEKIPPGTDWRESITRGILESDWVVAFLSAHSVRDPGVCLNELGIALNQKAGDNAMRTVLLENEMTARPPMSLTYIQWLDLATFEVNMPEDPTDPVQENHWNEWLNTQFQKLIESIEGGGSVAGDIAYLKHWLKPASFIVEIAAKTANFAGRHWLFEKIEDWRHNRRSQRVLWIKGPAGIGKSAIAAQLAHRERSTVLGIHFCKWNDTTTHDAANFVRTMAFQIASRHPDYRALLRDIIDSKFDGGRLQRAEAPELFRELIANPLAEGRMAIDAGRDRHVIVIDGLDEALRLNGDDKILDLVAEEFPKLPEWLGIIVTSRPAQELVARLDSPFELEAQSEENNEDLRDYLYKGLRTRFALDESGERKLDEAVKTAVNHSGGIMLYAVELLRDIHHGHIEPGQPNAFPYGLAGIYLNNLRRACPDLLTYRQETRPLLELIAGCPEALPEKVAKAMLGLDQAAFNDATKPVSTLLIRRGSHDDAGLELFHKSFGEWLTRPENPHCYQLENVGAYALADFLWAEYKAAMQGHAINEDGIDIVLKRKLKWCRFYKDKGGPRFWLNMVTDQAKELAKRTGDLEREVEFARREVSLKSQAFGTAHDIFELALDEWHRLRDRLEQS